MRLLRLKNDSDALAEYVDAAVVPREVGVNMLMRLDLVALKPRTILDMGHGMSFCTPLLSERYPDAMITTINLSEGVLKQVQLLEGAVNGMGADTFQLPILSKSIDLIIANLITPWMPDIKKLLCEWQRILRPEGLLLLTSLGPDTLMELRENINVLPQCMDMHDLGDELVEAGFIDPVLDVEHLTLKYRESKQLLHELNITHMIHSFLNNEKPLPLSITYEIIYGQAWGAPISAEYKADEEGIVRIPLSDLRRKTR
jgi:malonyl-CoA O-methyltransferase